MNKPYILGINGSPNPSGNCASALQTTLSAAEQTGATTNLIYLSMQFPHHDGRRPEAMKFEDRITEALPDRGGLREVVAEVLKADGIIFGTCTHSFTATTRILALFNWLETNTDYPDYRLAGKVAGFMSVFEECGGANANMAMVGPATQLGTTIPPFCTYFYNKQATGSEGNWQNTDRVLVGLNVRRMFQLIRGEIRRPITYDMWNDRRIDSW